MRSLRQALISPIENLIFTIIVSLEKDITIKLVSEVQEKKKGISKILILLFYVWMIQKLSKHWSTSP